MSENTSKCKKGNFYILKKGETLATVTERFNISISELLCANPYFDPNYYISGQTIIIPYCCDVKKHIISEKESLNDILRRYDTDTKTLRRLNPSCDLFNISAGYELLVPDKRNKADYIIQDNDTLCDIASKFGTDVLDILRKNPNLRPNEFVVGQGI